MTMYRFTGRDASTETAERLTATFETIRTQMEAHYRALPPDGDPIPQLFTGSGRILTPRPCNLAGDAKLAQMESIRTHIERMGPAIQYAALAVPSWLRSPDCHGDRTEVLMIWLEDRDGHLLTAQIPVHRSRGQPPVLGLGTPWVASGRHTMEGVLVGLFRNNATPIGVH